MFILYLLFCKIVTIYALSCQTESLNQNEYNALYDFYNSTSGAYWKWSSNSSIKWNFSSCEDPCKKKWEGIRCDSKNSSINTLDLKSHNLSGILPQSFGSFSNLTILNLGSNSLYGSNLYSMGNIFSKLTNLTILNFERNKLSGQLPINALTVISNLAELHLNENKFVGSIPAIVSNFKKLRLFKIRSNLNITGSIPIEFGELSSLLEVHLSNNSITGSIPDSIHRLSALTYLSFRNNKLTGTIPTFFGLFTKLEQLSLYDNSMTGTIPTELGNLSSLLYFYFQSNLYNGTIPSALGNLKKVENLLLFNNSLSESIPSTLGNLPNLTILQLHNNSLIGSIPESLSKSTKLKVLDLSNNQLSGKIPSSLFDITISNLSLSRNRFTGRIPEFDSISKTLSFFELNENAISGGIPNSIEKCSKLEEFYVVNNNLDGSIETLFNKVNHPKLRALGLSSNYFSGNFPSSIFDCPDLESVFASKSCFTSFPGEAICNAKKLVNLILVGMSISDKCNSNIFSFTDAYFSPNINAKLPSCVFSLPLLVDIQLSGLGLEGEIDTDLSLPNSAKFVRLDHNKLKGVIPSSFTRQNLRLLDLSANFISGEWDYINSTSTELNLYSNRLSGLPPQNADQMPVVNVLSGNKFDCSEDYQVTHDEKQATTACGSRTLDASLIIWGVSSFFVIILCFFLFFQFNKRGKRIRLVRAIYETVVSYMSLSPDEFIIPSGFRSPVDSKLREMIRLYACIAKIIFTVGFITLFLYLFLYGMIRDHGYDSHKYRYSWKYSGAYFTGMAPALVILIPYWCITLGIIFISRNLNIIRTSTRVKSTGITQSFQILGPLYLINSTVILVAYFLYVFAQGSDNIKNVGKIFIQILFSLFNVAWDIVIIPNILYYLKASAGIKFKGRLMCRIFNLLIASSLSTMIADPLCYEAMFVSQPKYQTSYVIPSCVEYTYSNAVMTCNKRGFIGPYVTEFVPPFLYSHICYSAILVNYSPVILYAAIIQVLYFPVNFFLPAKYTWAVDPIWNPKKIISYLKIPKMLSSALYYFTVILTFGVLSPVIMVPALLAFFLEVLTYAYFIRRFLLICTKLHEIHSVDKLESKETEITDTTQTIAPTPTPLPSPFALSPSPMYIKVKEVLAFNLDPETHRNNIVTCRYLGEEKIFYDRDKTPIALTELEKIVEEECANKNFQIVRPILFLSMCSCFFLGCVAWDMATTSGSIVNSLFLMLLSVFVPAAGAGYLRYHKKYDVLKHLSDKSKLDLSSNPLHYDRSSEGNNSDQGIQLETIEHGKSEIVGDDVIEPKVDRNREESTT